MNILEHDQQSNSRTDDSMVRGNISDPMSRFSRRLFLISYTILFLALVIYDVARFIPDSIKFGSLPNSSYSSTKHMMIKVIIGHLPILLAAFSFGFIFEKHLGASRLRFVLIIPISALAMGVVQAIWAFLTSGGYAYLLQNKSESGIISMVVSVAIIGTFLFSIKYLALNTLLGATLYARHR